MESNTRKRHANTKCGNCKNGSFWFEIFQCDKIKGLSFAKLIDDEYLNSESSKCNSYEPILTTETNNQRAK